MWMTSSVVGGATRRRRRPGRTGTTRRGGPRGRRATNSIGRSARRRRRSRHSAGRRHRHDRGRRARSPTSIHEGNSRSTVRPKSVARSHRWPKRSVAPLRSGSRKLGDDVPGADRRGRFEQPEKSSGSSSGPSRASSTSSTSHAGVGQSFAHAPDHRRVADQRDDLLAGSDGSRADADVVVTGGCGDVDLLERRAAEHREVGQRESGVSSHHLRGRRAVELTEQLLLGRAVLGDRVLTQVTLR